MASEATLMKALTVAIDGPAGAGKSTVAREVARRLGYLYVDTGAMYRAVALKALRQGVALDDAAEVTRIAREAQIRLEPPPDGAPAGSGVRVLLDGEEVGAAIRTPEVSDLSSRVSSFPGVREQMVRRQREMGQGGGVVMEGRDIGTVVFPEAEVKVFLDASTAERARRRRRELEARGIGAPLARVRQEIEERDARDEGRDTSPMVPAADAVELVTDGLSIQEVIERILALCRAAGEAV
jgi:cytidylate kinase